MSPLLPLVATLVGCSHDEPEAGPKKDDFETVAVDEGDITARVTASGTVTALVTVQVGAQVSGRISDLRVDFNDHVRRGEVLARLDPEFFQTAVDQARANTLASEANLARTRASAADAHRTAERAGQLAEQKLVSDAEALTAKTNADIADANVRVAEGQLAQARAAQHTAEVNLGYTTIISPIDGMVISRSVDVGQSVAASLSAPTLFVIAQDLSKMQVDTSVAEADIGKLQPGMAADFTVDAWPGQHFSALVRQVRNAATTIQNVVTYDAVLDVQNPDGKLRPGMTANVSFPYATREHVRRVPNAALRFRPPSGFGGEEKGKSDRKKGEPSKRTVWRLVDGNPQKVEVEVGLSDGTVTELVGDSLAVGELLVTSAPDSGGGKSQGGNAFRRGF